MTEITRTIEYGSIHHEQSRVSHDTIELISSLIQDIKAAPLKCKKSRTTQNRPTYLCIILPSQFPAPCRQENGIFCFYA